MQSGRDPLHNTTVWRREVEVREDKKSWGAVQLIRLYLDVVKQYEF